MGCESIQPISSFGSQPLGGAYLGSEGVSCADRIDEKGTNSPDGKHEADDSRGRILLGGISALQDAPEDKGCGRGANPPRPALASHHRHEQQSHLHIRGREQRGRRLGSESGCDLRGALHRATRSFALFASSLMLVGCGLFGGGRIALHGLSVQAPKDNGSPATVAKSDAGTVIPLPAGSEVIVVKETALPATDKIPAQPAKEMVTIRPNGPSEYHQTESKTAASTGTIDTSVKEHQIDAQESRPLLYASILAALAAGFFVYRAYPTPAICCGGASVVFFLCWRMADLPPWVAALGLAAIVGGVFLYVGHEKGLSTPKP